MSFRTQGLVPDPSVWYPHFEQERAGNEPQRNTVADLKRQLGEAKRAGDVTGEIATLLAMGKPLPKDPDLAFLHYRLAEKVILRAGKLECLHEALGGQGREHRRRKRFDEAI